MESCCKALTAAGRARLCAELLAAKAPLLAFDYDGTLAPTRHDPMQARVPQPTLAALQTLSQLARVAVISGRPRRELAVLLPGHELGLFGEYGVDGPISTVRIDPISDEVYAAWQVQIQHQLRLVGLRATRTERKLYSVNVDCLASAPSSPQLQRLGALLSSIDPVPVIRVGRYGIDLGYKSLPTKASAMAALIEAAKADFVMYCGDDTPDESVYELLRMQSDLLRAWTVHVNFGNSESASQYFVRGTSGLAHLLQCMARSVRQVLRVRASC